MDLGRIFKNFTTENERNTKTNAPCTFLQIRVELADRAATSLHPSNTKLLRFAIDEHEHVMGNLTLDTRLKRKKYDRIADTIRN